MKLASLLLLTLTTLSAPLVCRGEFVQLVDLPSNFQPGESFAFDVIIPQTTSLASYQIDLLLSSTTGTAGSDYLFGDVTPATSGYVFPSNADFGDGTNLESSMLQRLSLSDFDLDGHSTVAGVNDRIATVSVQTSAAFMGSLELSVDANRLILDGPQIDPTPVPEFNQIVTDTMNQPAMVVSAVPEPGSTCLILGALTACAGYRRRRGSSDATRVNPALIRDLPDER